MENYACLITHDGLVKRVEPADGRRFDVTELWDHCQGYVDACILKVKTKRLTKGLTMVYAAGAMHDGVYNEFASELLGYQVCGNVLLYWGYRTFFDELKEVGDIVDALVKKEKLV